AILERVHVHLAAEPHEALEDARRGPGISGARTVPSVIANVLHARVGGQTIAHLNAAAQQRRRLREVVVRYDAFGVVRSYRETGVRSVGAGGRGTVCVRRWSRLE